MSSCRIFTGDAHPGAGYGWIVGNMPRDAAALGDVEVLPWDCRDPMPEPEQDPDWDYFDKLAVEGGAVRVPEKVFNAVRQRVEVLTARP